MARCLLTGGAGFIGSHLAEALTARDHFVRVLDNFGAGLLSNLTAVGDRIELFVGTVIDRDAVRRAADGMDYVFHLAAAGSGGRSHDEAVLAHDVCATGTLNVLIAARDAGIRRVVYAASSSVYGAAVQGLVREGDPPQPLSAYAVAKLAGEHYCAVFSQLEGLETVRLRCFNVYGPRQSTGCSYASTIPLYSELLVSERRPVIAGDGQRLLDFTYVDDVVQANLLAMEAPRVAGKVYNIGGGSPASLEELVMTLNRLLGTQIEPVRRRAEPLDFRHNRPDISRAQTELGFCPAISLEEGLRRYLESASAERLESQMAPSGRATAAPRGSTSARLG